MFQIQRTVGSSHLDTNGTLRLSAAVDFMQDCCCFQLDSEKQLTEYFQKHHITMFLISRQIDLLKPAFYGDRLSIRTSIYQLRSSYGYRNTLIYSQSGELLIASYAGGAFVSLDKGGSTVMPRDILATVPLDAKFPDMEYLPRKVAVPKESAERTFEQTPVLRHYIDHNHHVNNARYIDIAQEYLPEDFTVKTCRIEYKTAAKYGDQIIPVRYRMAPRIWLISLQGTEGQVFSNVEFRG
ncbi:thioesterase [Anaerovorax odorimutans]|uniref:Thioesterase n=1 Tax=Anaerovorax odorimutans TaxID=109327 RepID=A0ABT1RRT8_9FIRM|nr:acyl-ACP thioesterase domain-containing protein [Anaerovorax odorimutans]MCQ4637911.1 thioesterase [Anaerovorax odorimutans]